MELYITYVVASFSSYDIFNKHDSLFVLHVANNFFFRDKNHTLSYRRLTDFVVLFTNFKFLNTWLSPCPKNIFQYLWFLSIRLPLGQSFKFDIRFSWINFKFCYGLHDHVIMKFVSGQV